MDHLLEKLGAMLPAWHDGASLSSLCPPSLWEKNPHLAAMSALSRSGEFNEHDYLRRYPDVESANLDPIYHFVNHGINEGRHFKSNNQRDIAKANTEYTCKKLESLSHRDSKTPSCSVIIRLESLASVTAQYRALMRQSAKPCEIIYVVQSDSFSSKAIRKATSNNVKIVRSDFNSRSTLLAAAQMAAGKYIALVDLDVCPGRYWLANAIRACKAYNALAVGRGLMFIPDQGTCRFVSPKISDDNNISCSANDIFCDCGYMSLVFKHEWWFNLQIDIDIANVHQLYTAIAVALHKNAGINCVAPMQPAFDERFHCTSHKEFEESEHIALNSGQYLAQQTSSGYVPVHKRDNLIKFHILSVFGDRNMLKRCILSVKGQTYSNYDLTLIDDCCDKSSARDIIKEYGLEGWPFRYIHNRIKLFAIAGYANATDLLNANPADVVVHLDGDDWFAHAHVLSQLNSIYRLGLARGTYGIAWRLNSHIVRNFKEYSTVPMWYSYNSCDPSLSPEPVHRLTKAQLAYGWANAPWYNLHTRTFAYAGWLAHNKETFLYQNGTPVHYPADAVTFIPIFDKSCTDEIIFVPDPGYVYQTCDNVTSSKGDVTELEKAATSSLVTHTSNIDNCVNVINTLLGKSRNIMRERRIARDAEIIYDGITAKTETKSAIDAHKSKLHNKLKSAVVTIVTPDYISDGLMCLCSYVRNLSSDCHKYIFICTFDINLTRRLESIFNHTSIVPIFPHSLLSAQEKSDLLLIKYRLESDSYRWAMKTVLLLELLARGYDMALFLDPDIYTVDNVDDMHNRLFLYNLSVFPHFRNPDMPHTRKTLYTDGFYNGGMLAATIGGIKELVKTYWRTFEAVERNPEKDLFGVQKYYNLFHLEEDDICVNHDQGVNYCTWNKDPIVGFIAPDQRSCLLESGYFARIWHLSTNEMHSMIRGKNDNYKKCRPVVAIYLLSNMFIIILIAIKDKYSNGYPTIAKKLMKRFNYFADRARDLSTNMLCEDICALWESVCANSYASIEESLRQWHILFMKSICYNNIELFVKLLSEFFPDNYVSQSIIADMHMNDLRYITEYYIASGRISQYGKFGCEPDCKIADTNLDILKKTGIEY